MKLIYQGKIKEIRRKEIEQEEQIFSEVLNVKKDTKNENLINDDCIKIMKTMEENSVDFTLTDIPYNAVSRKSNGLRNLDKEEADILTFNLHEFLELVYKVTKNNICIFCGKEQFSQIFEFFAKLTKL